MGGLLTIETGFTCNSRCRYCTQLDYRVIPQADKLDLPTEEIRERIAFAGSNGYDQVGFSGGEPTIRPDFAELIAFAKEHGFRRIGVTTNGRMLAYKSFTEAAMKAGLDGFTFSLHGDTPEVHDRITNAKGALEQAMAGLRNIAETSKRFGLEAHLMNNQILLPENTHLIREVVETMAPFGTRLFMIQPFIAQRSNSDEIERFFVPYDAIVAAVERAIPALERFGARIKPYNVPNCLLWRFGPRYIEPQFYGIRPFREHEQQGPGEFRAFKVRQWFRVPQCRDCEEMCPGFRIEQYPQPRLVDDLVAAADEFVAPRADDDAPRSLLFGGTELFTAAALETSMRRVAAAHGPVAWMTGLCERTERRAIAKLLPRASAAGWLDEVVLVGSPMDRRFLAQRVLEKGNLEELRAGLHLIGEARERGATPPKLRLLLNIGDAQRLLDDEAVSGHWLPLLRALRRAVTDAQTGAVAPALADLCFAVPNFPRGQRPPEMARQREEVKALGARLAAAAAVAGFSARLVVFGDRRGVDPIRADATAIAEAALGEALPPESWADRLFRHPGSMPEMDFLSWSPPWIFERFAEHGPAYPAEATDAAPDVTSAVRVG
ncbi:MAG: radical SAM protein [Deltaproteobacteria bacterium]|nr:radical SAM protein [Deltaproteobacteria bacterium]